MQVYYLYNKEGAVFRRSSACFGSLAALGEVCWGSSLEIVSSKDVDYLVISPNESATESHFDDIKKAYEAVKGVVESGFFPQYLSPVSFDVKPGCIKHPNLIKIQLAGESIQPSMIGTFMVRNAVVYFTKRSVFTNLLDAGCDPDIALVLANIFDYSISGLKNSDVSYYIGGGDASIFSGYANMGDVLSLFRGETWNYFAGEWGDLKSGYPRYGFMDSDETEPSPVSQRVYNHLTLTDTTMAEKDYDGYQSIHTYFSEVSGDGSGRIPRDVFISKVVPAFTEYVREGVKNGKI